ncbi:MAG: PEP-CTERM sorting domain-containing protein [Planctomycetota bacterium]
MKNFTLFCAATLVSGSACAVPITETFTYVDGDLVGNGGWTNISGSGDLIQVVSGQAVLSHGGGSREDLGLPLGFDFTTGTVTASFDLIVTDDSAISGSDSEYFAHFSNAGSSSSFVARLDVVPGGSGGDYSLGISTISSTAEATLPVDFTFGVTVPVELTFDLDAGLADLTVGTDSVASTTVSTGETINMFNLRQSNSSSDETITIDNLSIVPEPGSAILAGLGAVAMLRRRSA